MFAHNKIKYIIAGEIVAILLLSCVLWYQKKESLTASATLSNEESKKDYIKWVDFKVTCEAMNQAYQYDVETKTEEIHLNWIELLAYLAVKYGGDFKQYKAKDMEELAERLKGKEESMESLTEGMKYYSYYLEAYTAVLGGLVGDYEVEVNRTKPSEEEKGENTESKIWEKRYGLKGFSPIAKGYEYNDYDDFGVSRSYGYKRAHLGHDMMGQVGTPIIAVESGYIEVMGWNQYGGWRIGIRSFDQKRYYYYAHLRKNFPYHKSLKEGDIVQAGDVIGYLGRTGYSKTENTNNIDTAHLHFGLQLIFDESQKEGSHEIWVDCYQLARFLSKNRSETRKNPETKDYYRVYEIRDPAAESYQNIQQQKE